jgi:hypothetical protein
MVLLIRQQKSMGPSPHPNKLQKWLSIEALHTKGMEIKVKIKVKLVFPRYLPPKSNVPINADLNIDLGGWLNNAKMLVPVSEIMKIPSQREKLLKAIEEPPKSVVEKQPAVAYQDAPVILQNWDRKK